MKKSYFVRHNFFNTLTCFRNKHNNLLYKMIESKMTKIISFENIIKLTKSHKLVKLLLFDEYQRNMFKICPVPRKNKIISIEQVIYNFINESKGNNLDRKMSMLLLEE